MSCFTQHGSLRRARTALAGAAITATVLTAPTAASAAATTVSRSGPLLSVIAGAGDANSYLVRRLGNDVIVLEMGSGTITAGAGCVTTSTKRAACPIASVKTIGVNAKDLNDTIDVDVTGIVDTYLNGDTGNDTLRGVNAAVADVFAGGGGSDVVTYAGSANDVGADLDGVADDGNGVVDHLQSSVEGIIGGNGNDSLTGAASTAIFTSTLAGGPGNDTITSGGGSSVIEGNAGNDTLVGAGGIDWIYGGTGTDSLDGKAGDDIVDADDGAGGDTVKCGLGNDYLPYNLGDTQLDSPNCETTQLF